MVIGAMNFSENFFGLKFSSFIFKFSNSEMCLCHQLSLSLFDGKSLMFFQILRKNQLNLSTNSNTSTSTCVTNFNKCFYTLKFSLLFFSILLLLLLHFSLALYCFGMILFRCQMMSQIHSHTTIMHRINCSVAIQTLI